MDIETYVCRLLMPPSIFTLVDAESELIDIDEDEAERTDFETYKERIRSIVFSSPRNYAGFRTFVRANRSLYGDDCRKLENLTNEEIDQVFERIREITVEHMFDEST